MRSLCLAILLACSAASHATTPCEAFVVPRLNKEEAKAFKAHSKKEGSFKTVSVYTEIKDGPFIVQTMPGFFKPIAFLTQWIPGKVGFFAKMVLETPGKAMMLMQPELIHEVFKHTKELNRPYKGLGNVIGQQSFFLLDNSKPDEHEKWELAHQLIMPHFLPRKIIQDYMPQMQTILRDLIAEMKRDQVKEITVGEFSFYFAARVASALFLHHDLTLEEARMLRPATDAILTDKQGREAGGRVLHQFLLEKTKTDQPSALVQDLLRYQQEHSLPDDWMSSQLATLYFASVETTQSLLGTSLYYLTKDSKWADTVREEYLSFDEDETLKLNKTPQIRNVLNESLRMHAPVPAFYRYSNQNFQLGSYLVPKGTMVYLSLQSMHRDPKIWGASADEFDPHRFENDPDGHLMKSLIPFGGGIRVCIGKYLAMMEAALFLGEMTSAFNLSMPEDQKLPLGYASGTLRVKDELKIQIQPR